MAQTHIATTPNDGRGLRGLELPYIGNGLNVPQRIVAERQELLAGILNNDIGDNLRSNTTQVLRLMSPANALSYGLNDGDNDSTTVRDNRVDLLLRTRISTGLYNRLQEFINERVSDEGSSSAEAPSLVLNRRRRAAASKGDEPTKSTSSATVGGKSSNSKNTRNNVILLRGAADVGKSYLMMELALRLLSLNRDEVRVVYIKDCAEWARKDGLYGKIEYLVRALKLAFIDDEGFDQMFVDFPPTRAEAAGVTAEDVFKHIESYCEAKAKNGAALKVVFFFDNFEAAYKSVNSAGQRDIESVFGRIRIRPQYFFSVITSRTELIDQLAISPTRIPRSFYNDEAEVFTLYKCDGLGDNEEVLEDILRIVRIYTHFHPLDASLLLDIIRGINIGDDEDDLRRATTAARKFVYENTVGLNVATVRSYSDPATQNYSDASKSSIFCVYNYIHKDDYLVDNTRSGDCTENINGHCYISQSGEAQGRIHMFSSPRKANFVFREVVGEQARLFEEIGKNYGSTQLERDQLGYSAVLWSIKNGRFREYSQRTSEFGCSPLNYFGATDALHLDTDDPSSSADADMYNMPSPNGIRALAFHGDAMTATITKGPGAVDIAMCCNEQDRLYYAFVFAMVQESSEIMEIINHYKKHVSSSKGTENSITDSSNINLTKLRVSEALSEIAKRKNDDSFTEYIVYLVTSESAATGFYTEYKKKYHSCGEFDLRVLGITELQELHDIRIRHFTGN